MMYQTRTRIVLVDATLFLQFMQIVKLTPKIEILQFQGPPFC